MAYLALYRKWRPRTFDEVRGQDHIVTALRNQIMMDRTGHAYLFCGTRGTGKTSIAKIFARAVNCMHPVNGNPCNECELCRAANEQRSMNVIEIDAASNNGVDNIRQIREEVAYPPASGRYKVYIIDEVHMLSIGAFNALLKTLEEPPSYVIFILATTEVNKIPVTILSRCQRYDFRRITTETIAGRLRELADAEKIDVTDEALAYIARKADGSMRDSLSLFDQCNAFYAGQSITYDKVLDVLGAVDTSVFSALLQGVLSGDTGSVLKLISDVSIQGREMSQFADDFTWYLRNMLILRTDPAGDLLVDASAAQIAEMRSQAETIDPEILIRYIRVFSELSGQMRYHSQKRILLEVALIKLCRPAMETNLDSLYDRIRVLEDKLESGAFIQQAADLAVPGQVKQEAGYPAYGADDPVVRLKPKADQEDIRKIIGLWEEIKADMPGFMNAALAGSRPEEGKDGHLIIKLKKQIGYDYLTGDRMSELERIVSERSGCQVNIDIAKMRDEIRDEGPDISSIFEGVPISEED